MSVAVAELMEKKTAPKTFLNALLRHSEKLHRGEDKPHYTGLIWSQKNFNVEVKDLIYRYQNEEYNRKWAMYHRNAEKILEKNSLGSRNIFYVFWNDFKRYQFFANWEQFSGYLLDFDKVNELGISPKGDLYISDDSTWGVAYTIDSENFKKLENDFRKEDFPYSDFVEIVEGVCKDGDESFFNYAKPVGRFFKN